MEIRFHQTDFKLLTYDTKEELFAKMEEIEKNHENTMPNGTPSQKYAVFALMANLD